MSVQCANDRNHTKGIKVRKRKQKPGRQKKDKEVKEHFFYVYMNNKHLLKANHRTDCKTNAGLQENKHVSVSLGKVYINVYYFEVNKPLNSRTFFK